MHLIRRKLLTSVIAFVAVCLWFTPTTTIAQALWREAKAGMSLETVRGQFPSATPPVRPTKLRDGSQEALRLSGVSVQGQTFDAMFFFKNKKLVQINLELQEKGSAIFGLQTFRGIRSALESEYGPTDDEQDQDYKAPTGPALFKLVSWRSGRTLITLSYVTAAGKLQLLNIAYRIVPGGKKTTSEATERVSSIFMASLIREVRMPELNAHMLLHWHEMGPREKMVWATVFAQAGGKPVSAAPLGNLPNRLLDNCFLI